ncbi:MAG: hypothetical protein CMN78_01790 [Spirochaetales bacterium]|nr:hypothetical protein [Spirochaetales bacterium]
MKFCVLFLIFISFSIGAPAQDKMPPFASRFVAVSTASGIRLSWQDANDAEGNYYVYRHTEEIVNNNVSEAELLEIVDKGTQLYIDVPPADIPHFYAVLASDAEGKTYDFLVSFRNKTTNSIIFREPEEVAEEVAEEEPQPEEEESPVAQAEQEPEVADVPSSETVEEPEKIETPEPEPEPEEAAVQPTSQVAVEPEPSTTTTARRRRIRVSTVPVQDLRARVDDTDIVLEYTLAEEGDFVIYRSTEPILSQEDLLNAILVETISSDLGAYRDFPLAGVPYYYGVFADRLLRTGGIEFIAETNITSQPITISLTEETAARFEQIPVRVQPLPFLILATTIDTGERLQTSTFDLSIEPKQLMPETAEALRSLLEHSLMRDNPPLQAGLLPEDASEGILHDMLQSSFSTQDWPGAKDILIDFLKIRRPDNIEQRARFYLGQCQFFLGNYQESFLEFVFAEEGYYGEAQQWIDTLIDRLSTNQ